MKSKIDKLSSAMEDIDASYLEEALNYEPRARVIRPERRHFRLPRLSVACTALLIVAVMSAGVFAISRLPLSWRDIFSPNQTVIGDGDEKQVVSEQTVSEPSAVSDPDKGGPADAQQASVLKDISIDVSKAISDERMLYLLYTMTANNGAVISPEGRFASFDLHFPGKMMSGVYQQCFLERREGVPENELEGIIYADWQPDVNAKSLELDFTDWQEKRMFGEAKVDIDIAGLVSAAGENEKLQALKTFDNPEYLWQPGDKDIRLPYGDISICNAGWEDGILQIVMKGPRNDAGEWTDGRNWYLIDTRTDSVINPDQRAFYHTPDELDKSLQDTDWHYIWNFVSVDEDALPYLEMYCGGKESYATALKGQWKVNVGEAPVTVTSEVLARKVKLTYLGEQLPADRIECSKLSLAVYFTDYVDSTTGILSKFEAFDSNGNPVRCDWGFTADANDNGCMIWARFAEPVDPESICLLTFNGETIFIR